MKCLRPSAICHPRVAAYNSASAVDKADTEAVKCRLEVDLEALLDSVADSFPDAVAGPVAVDNPRRLNGFDDPDGGDFDVGDFCD